MHTSYPRHGGFKYTRGDFRSEEWTHTLVDVKFLDTVSGDVLVALRNNKGGPLRTGPPEHFVTVHPRSIQTKVYDGAPLFDLMYSTSQDRIDRLTLFKMSTTAIAGGFDPFSQQILAIADMFVIPTGKGDGRQPWVLLSVVVAPTDEQMASSSSSTAPSGSIYESYRRDICINLNLDIFVSFAGEHPFLVWSFWPGSVALLGHCPGTLVAFDAVHDAHRVRERRVDARVHVLDAALDGHLLLGA